jgi:hypothetical protein
VSPPGNAQQHAGGGWFRWRSNGTAPKEEVRSGVVFAALAKRSIAINQSILPASFSAIQRRIGGHTPASIMRSLQGPQTQPARRSAQAHSMMNAISKSSTSACTQRLRGSRVALAAARPLLRAGAGAAPFPNPSRGPRAPAAAAAGPAAPADAAQLADGFDLGAAVAMAAAAFEAYLEPTGGSFKERSVNSTETTYTSRCVPLCVRVRSVRACVCMRVCMCVYPPTRMRSAWPHGLGPLLTDPADQPPPTPHRPRNDRAPPPTPELQLQNRDFLLEAFDGILEVTLEGATGLKAVNKVCLSVESGGVAFWVVGQLAAGRRQRAPPPRPRSLTPGVPSPRPSSPPSSPALCRFIHQHPLASNPPPPHWTPPRSHSLAAAAPATPTHSSPAPTARGAQRWRRGRWSRSGGRRSGCL